MLSKSQWTTKHLRSQVFLFILLLKLKEKESDIVDYIGIEFLEKNLQMILLKLNGFSFFYFSYLSFPKPIPQNSKDLI